MSFRLKSLDIGSLLLWAKHLDLILQADSNAHLQNAGAISAEIAKQHAESEYEKYRVVQDSLFDSDFDKQMKLIQSKHNSPAEIHE